MGGIAFLMASSFSVLLIISSLSPSCHASCIGRLCPPCIKPPSYRDCNKHYCQILCQMMRMPSDHAYCRNLLVHWTCCCPQP
ncbi:hypothetical protein SEVIR_8G138000v4 [Setaria viridis]|uniref:Uncharacterized protein n=2 Tax=Setaria TaxID=4554 RepID=A0A368S781_SETIT|nr:hypothetical protein SETIT_8G130600v2 [Setaria italica]TKW00830.1 hypothetical protein SEVIR_8G138000v2 [Setaria viridis]